MTIDGDDSRDLPEQSAWQVALVKYELGYGEDPDFNNTTDCYCYLQLLEETVRDRLTRQLVEAIDKGTARINAIGKVPQ